MAKKLEIKQGDKFGKWTIIEEIAPKIMVTRKEVRYGTEYSVSLQYFIENEVDNETN